MGEREIMGGVDRMKEGVIEKWKGRDRGSSV